MFPAVAAQDHIEVRDNVGQVQVSDLPGNLGAWLASPAAPKVGPARDPEGTEYVMAAPASPSASGRTRLMT